MLNGNVELKWLRPEVAAYRLVSLSLIAYRYRDKSIVVIDFIFVFQSSTIYD
jgi:hypothetical protein